LKDSTTYLLQLGGDSELQMCVEAWPCNLVFSCFNSPIDWARVRYAECPPQIRVREQGLDVFGVDSCGFELCELDMIGVCLCVGEQGLRIWSGSNT